MLVYVTGATGFVGGHVVSRLVADGHRVVAFVRSLEKFERMLDVHGLDPALVRPVVGDITDEAAITSAIEGCDAAVHTAAAVALTPDAVKKIGSINHRGTQLVLGAAHEAGLDPIVHVSSIAALSPPQGTIIRATDPIPSNGGPYGASKAACDREARTLQDQGAPVVIVYPGGIIGPLDAGSHVVGDGWAAALAPGFMPVISKGGGSYIDARDLAAIIGKCMEPGRGPRRYMAGGEYIDYERNADLLDLATGKKWKRRTVPAGLLVFLGKVGDTIGRFKKGFAPPIGHEAAISMTTHVPTDDSAVRDELGVQYRSLEDSFSETMEWLVSSGRMPPHNAPRWPAPPESPT